MRGFASIGLHRPQKQINVGLALRAAVCFDAAFVAISDCEYRGLARTDTQKAWRHLPLFQVDDLQTLVPFDTTPVAVDLLDGATPLPEYKHPERAFYIFGPENGTLGDDITGWCQERIQVPTSLCMNLAVTVNIVLYDRLTKVRKRPNAVT